MVPSGPPGPRVDNAMVKALARAFRWRQVLDTGVYATLEELAKAKGVHATYVSRVLRLTLLAPEIVEAILDGRQPAGCSWMICCRRIRNSRAGKFKLSFGQLTLIRRGIAFSAFGSTSVITPSLSSALIPSCSILLEI